MDKDSIKAFAKYSTLYLPTITLFYLLEKNNELYIFILLMISTISIILYDLIRNNIEKKLNFNKITNLENKNKQILEVEKQMKKNKLLSKEKIVFTGFLQVIILTMNIYSIYMLITNISDFVALYILIFGGIPSWYHYSKTFLSALTNPPKK